MKTSASVHSVVPLKHAGMGGPQLDTVRYMVYTRMKPLSDISWSVKGVRVNILKQETIRPQAKEPTVLQQPTPYFGKTGNSGPSPVSDVLHKTDIGLTLLVGGIPFFFRRCAVTHELFELVIEFRPTMTSFGLAEHIHCECWVDLYRSESNASFRAPSASI